MELKSVLDQLRAIEESGRGNDDVRTAIKTAETYAGRGEGIKRKTLKDQIRESNPDFLDEEYTDHMNTGAWDEVTARAKKDRDSYPGGPEAYAKMKDTPTGPSDHEFLNRDKKVKEDDGMIDCADGPDQEEAWNNIHDRVEEREGGEDEYYADDDPENVDFNHQHPNDNMDDEMKLGEEGDDEIAQMSANAGLDGGEGPRDRIHDRVEARGGVDNGEDDSMAGGDEGLAGCDAADLGDDPFGMGDGDEMGTDELGTDDGMVGQEDGALDRVREKSNRSGTGGPIERVQGRVEARGGQSEPDLDEAVNPVDVKDAIKHLYELLQSGLDPETKQAVQMAYVELKNKTTGAGAEA